MSVISICKEFEVFSQCLLKVITSQITKNCYPGPSAINTTSVSIILLPSQMELLE